MKGIQNQRIESICDSLEIDGTFEEILEENATNAEIERIKNMLNQII